MLTPDTPSSGVPQFVSSTGGRKQLTEMYLTPDLSPSLSPAESTQTGFIELSRKQHDGE